MYAEYCDAIMDDFLQFTPGKRSHRNILEDLLKALLKGGLKMLLKKCQLFKIELQYIGYTIFIKRKGMHKAYDNKGRDHSNTETSYHAQRM